MAHAYEENRHPTATFRVVSCVLITTWSASRAQSFGALTRSRSLRKCMNAQFSGLNKLDRKREQGTGHFQESAAVTGRHRRSARQRTTFCRGRSMVVGEGE